MENFRRNKSKYEDIRGKYEQNSTILWKTSITFENFAKKKSRRFFSGFYIPMHKHRNIFAKVGENKINHPPYTLK